MRVLAMAALLLALALQAGTRAEVPADVVFLDAPRVAAAFAKGEPLVETAPYKVHASRRSGHIGEFALSPAPMPR